MSTRFYPRFVKGNPQLRIFLPDWKMVMVKPTQTMPDHVVTFKVDPRMTDWDVKNYLEKIYKVQVGAIKSAVMAGSLKKLRTGLTKRDDFKLVYVSLPTGTTFKWPDLFPKEKLEDQEADMKRTLAAVNEGRTLDPNTRIPGWVGNFLGAKTSK